MEFSIDLVRRYRYPDMPPEALLVRQLGRNVRVDLDELRRAKWFWERRPKKLILSPEKSARFLILCLCLWILSASSPEQLPATAVIRDAAWVALFAASVAVFVDVLRYAHWKWVYRCAISRLLAAVSRQIP